MKEMRILLINDFLYSGGAETVFRETLCLLRSSEDSFIVDSFYASERHRMSKNPLEYIFSKLQFKRLSEKLESFGPDVIHLHVFHHLLSPSILMSIRSYRKKFRLVKVVYTAHDYHLVYPNSSLLRYRRNKPILVNRINYFKAFFHKVDNRGVLYSLLKKYQWYFNYKVLGLRNEINTILCPSYFMKGVLEEYLLDQEILVTRNPIKIDNNNTRVIKNTSQVKLVFFGRLSIEKGLSELIEYLARTSEDFTLDIYGDGPEFDLIEELIKLNFLESKVYLKGFLNNDDLKVKLPNYDAMVLPSIWYENAPMSILEAGLVGITIVGSSLGGIPELAKLTGNYVLFDHSSISNFDEVIKKCRDARYITDNNFSEFSLSSYSKSLLRVYCSVNNA